MSGEPAFREEGVIVNVIEPGLFRVGLPNGHRFFGYVLRQDLPVLQPGVPGDRVTVEFTAYDLSKGRVRTIERKTV